MGLQYLLVRLLEIYQLVLIARVVVSWLNVDSYNPVISFLYRVTDPLLNKIRELLPQTGAIDFSPLVALLLIQVVRRILFRI